ncbi:MAG: DUF1800 family protein [Verrucomicrobia bacterium]|nr:DUF1800 family protein [Verrucomicrobiota bacterium]
MARLQPRCALVALLSCLLAAPAAPAAIDTGINATVWKLLYGVSDAQINDPAWLARDDDGDGISNGNELLAGTNPFKASSTAAVSGLATDGTTTSVSFASLRGKRYTLEVTTSLDGRGWAAVAPAVQTIGTGNAMTVTTPAVSGRAFYRLRVDDVDSDNDGVSDWAERVVGYDPTTGNTRGNTLDDRTSILNGLAQQNVISVVATKSTATQPPSSATAASDVGTFLVSRGGALHFSTITVPLTKSGTAAVGLDYTSLPGTVTFTPGVSAIPLTVVPLANPALQTSATVTLKAEAGAGFTVGSAGAASVAIAPAGNANGTGLQGEYFNSTSTAINAGYSAALFNPANLRLTRTDSLINFTYATGVAPGTGVNSTYYVVRWTGQVQPQFTGTYYFVTRTDDGVKLWVNGQLIIDRWVNQGATDLTGAIELKAGVLYDLRMEYYQATGGATQQLSWYSDSQVKQIIPTGRLYPAGSTLAPPALVNGATAVGFVGQPFSFAVTASNALSVPTTYALGANSLPLPNGLTLSASTGAITGTPTVAGETQIALQATNANGTGAGVLTIRILPAGSGITREVWTAGVTGPQVADIPVNATPAVDTSLLTPDDATPRGNNVGQRWRGYFTAPTTGNYYFWLAASGAAELWIANDAEPINKVRRARIGTAGTGRKVWNADPAQKSPWLTLTAGSRYYYEILHNTGANGAGAHLALGYFLDPTGTTASPIANGSGVAPAHLFTRFDYPQSIATPGTLFVTNMAPQGAAQTTATGSATLRLNPAGTQATLHFNYRGLSSPRTAYHLHADPSGQIIFDIDDADSFHPDLRTADGGYIWNITAVGSYTATEIADLINQGKVYLNIHSVTYPAGEIRGNLGKVLGSQNPPAPVPDPGYTDDSNTDAGAARFLGQAAFGAAPSDVARVKALGYAGWIDEQMAIRTTHILQAVFDRAGLVYSTSSAVGISPGNMANEWWRSAVTARDQLRQRVAFALSQIFVISGRDGDLSNRAHTLAGYYDMLATNAFGNARELLEQVTLHPGMGVYLDMRANQKANLSTGLIPNENFAREILQLFSVGLNRMWPDGTLMLDSAGGVIPTYRQNEIIGFARIFTGWNWNQPLVAGRLPTNFSPTSNYLDPMVLVPSRHELGTKLLLDNVMLPAAVGFNPTGSPVTGSEADPAQPAFDTYCLNDFERALDNIFANANVGPYLCRQLIQRLVMSDPSPGYVARVVAKFDNDGTGVRGNLGAVVRAILLDGEARNSTLARTGTTNGKQREPLLRIAAPARTLAYTGRTGTWSQSGSQVITVTTSTPHLLAAGNAVGLEFAGNAPGQVPSDLTTPSDASYSVLSTPAPTATTFAVNATGLVVANYSQPANSNVITVSTAGPPVESFVYLKFTSGGAPDGVFRVTAQNGTTSFTVNSGETVLPTTARSGTALLPRIPITYSVTNAGSVSTLMIRANNRVNFNLSAGQSFWLDADAANTAILADGQFAVGTIHESYRFSVDSTGLTAETDKTGVLYPLVPPPLTRSGTLAQAGSKFDLGSTQSQLAQTPMDSPTVFNFFYPDYKYPGPLAAANITTPEFQLTTDTNIVTLTNNVSQAILSGGSTAGLSSFRAGSGGVVFDLSPYMTAPYSVADTAGVTALVNTLDGLLTGGLLTTETKNVIIGFVANNTNFPTASATNVRDRVRAIVQLILISPEYAVQR